MEQSLFHLTYGNVPESSQAGSEIRWEIPDWPLCLLLDPSSDASHLSILQGSPPPEPCILFSFIYQILTVYHSPIAAPVTYTVMPCKFFCLPPASA